LSTAIVIVVTAPFVKAFEEVVTTPNFFLVDILAIKGFDSIS
jgi:hypothetical protein